jgi:hypothetical protein
MYMHSLRDIPELLLGMFGGLLDEEDSPRFLVEPKMQYAQPYKNLLQALTDQQRKVGTWLETHGAVMMEEEDSEEEDSDENDEEDDEEDQQEGEEDDDGDEEDEEEEHD